MVAAHPVTYEQLAKQVDALQAELASLRAQNPDGERAGEHSAAAEIINDLLQ